MFKVHPLSNIKIAYTLILKTTTELERNRWERWRSSHTLFQRPLQLVQNQLLQRWTRGWLM